MIILRTDLLEIVIGSLGAILNLVERTAPFLYGLLCGFAFATLCFAAGWVP